jgi:hypothetical protein
MGVEGDVIGPRANRSESGAREDIADRARPGLGHTDRLELEFASFRGLDAVYQGALPDRRQGRLILRLATMEVGDQRLVSWYSFAATAK